ncbi:MAG: phage tail protein [Haloferacaceae archaeon]
MTEFAFLGTQTPAGWDDWQFDNAVLDDGAVRLRSDPLPAYVDPTEAVVVPADESPVAAVDVADCGDCYLLRESGVVERYDAEADRRWRFDCTGVDLAAGTGRDLLVTPETVYVAQSVPGESGAGGGPARRGRIVAVSRHVRQTRWVVDDPDAVPVALTDRDGQVYALFETVDGGRLDRLDPDGSRTPAVEGLTGPRDATFDDAGLCSILDEAGGAPVVRRVGSDALDAGAPVAAPAPWSGPVPTGASSLAGGREGELLVGRRGGETGAATLFRLSAGARDGLAGFDAGVAQLELAGRLYALSADGRVVWTLAPRERFRRDETTGAYDARVVRSLDAGEPGTEWHRITLGFRTPDPETQVRVRYAATDDPIGARDVDWRAVTPADPRDALLEGAVGRYLWVQIELVGGVYGTPELEAFRAYFPRQSYLRYLPAIYQADPESRAFLEAFLSLFESTNVGIEEQIAAVTRYLDPDGIPPAYLDWLEGWLALETDETWPASGRRRLLNEAPALFRERGTPDGILDLVSVYLDAVADPSAAWEALAERQRHALAEREERGELSPADARTLRRRIESNSFLLEYADLDCVEGEAREAYTRLLECPQCFFVFVRPFVTDEQFRAVQSLVDDNRPAHAVGRAVELEPSILLGGHSYLGINSVLPERDLVVGAGRLGQDSVLDEREGAGQLDVRSRLGEDTTLS